MYGLFRFTLQGDVQHEISTPINVRNPITGGTSRCNAIWDTGATSSMIAANVAKHLSLTPTSTVAIAGVHGIKDAPCYYVDVLFDNGALLRDIKVAEASNVGGFGLLVGMDIIGKGVFRVDGTNNYLQVDFEVAAEHQQ